LTSTISRVFLLAIEGVRPFRQLGKTAAEREGRKMVAEK
jgi:hypothetical protein